MRDFLNVAGFNGIELYGMMRPYLQTGDVLEWRAEHALGYAIRWFTKRDVNHTGGVYRFTAGLTQEMYDRVYTLEALSKGFYPNWLSSGLFNYKGKVYVLPLKTELAWAIPRIASEQWKLIGTPYDFGGLVKNALGYVSEDLRSVFCSEAIASSFRKGGLIPTDYKDGKALRPGDFADLDCFQDRVRIY
jgi:hypothetical protein